MCSSKCCLIAFGILLSQVALIFWPVIKHGSTEVELDDMATWGLKGPGLSSLPTANMRGIWYLAGNQTPKPCVEGTEDDPTKCRNGFKRSGVMMIDSSYCFYEQSTITCGSKCFVTSKEEGKFGSAAMAVLRAEYVVRKDDLEFVGRDAGLFEGAMHLKMLGSFLPDIPVIGSPYRVTGEDVNGDGSIIQRFTWWGKDADTPQEKSEHDKDWFYEMKRVMNEAGEIDETVLNEIKSTYGDTAFVGWTIPSPTKP